MKNRSKLPHVSTSTRFVRLVSVSIYAFFFAVGIVVLPAANTGASAPLGPRVGGAAKVAGNLEQRLLGNPAQPATSARALTASQQPRVDSSGEDPDLPPFMKGADKAEYLRLRAEHLALLRGVPYETPYNPRVRAIRQMEQQITSNAPNINGTSWTPIGPAPIPNGQTQGGPVPVSGRTISIAVHPTNPDIVYAGTAQGGLYRTLDGGTTWTAIFDTALSLAIGAVAIAPSSPSTVFVGTGESGFSIDSYFGVGVYRIDNADTIPTLNGPFNSDGVSDIFTGRSISELVVHPTDPNIIFVGSTFGIGGVSVSTPPTLPPVGLYRSTNALSGSPTFAKLNVPTAAVPPRNITDVVLEPDNPSNLVCAVMGNVGANDGGIWRTTNALDATPVFTRTQTLGTVVGNPDIRIELAINKVGSTVTVYAATGEPMQAFSLCEFEGRRGALRKSINGGASFTGGPAPGSATQNANAFCGFQCFYNIAVAVDPNNASIMYLGGQDANGCSKIVKKSIDGGGTFVTNDTGLHADTHAITVAPSDSSIIYLGGDGGIWKSTDTGATWTSLNNTGFSATQFESVAVHPTDQFFTIGGTQDNGTNFQKPDNTWTRADFGDGGFALIDQNAADTTNVTMYHTYANSTSAMAYARVTNTASAVDGGWTILGCGPGTTANGMTCPSTAILFYAPIALGPGNPNTLYFGSDRLWRSSDGGTNMSLVSQAPIVSMQPISAIGISPQNDDVRVVGLRNGKVFRTTTASSVLTDVTGTIPAKYISRAVVDPANVDTAYVALGGFGLAAGQHVWKTTDLSNAMPTWTAVGGTGGNVIPDVPVNAFAVDASDPTLPGVSVLYAGTDIGVYRSTNGGTDWLPFGAGLPRVAVFDMAIQQLHRFLRIATHGRGMWEISLPGAPTEAKLTGFTVEGYEPGQFLRWQTGVEVDNLGFNVYRDEDGKRTRLNAELLAGSALVTGPGTALTAGKSYTWWDGAPRSKSTQYWLEEVNLEGESIWHGPVSPEFVVGAPADESQPAALSKLGNPEGQIGSTRPVDRMATPIMVTAAQAAHSSLASMSAVKLAVREEGLVRVTQPELVAVGLDPKADPRLLQLYVDGRKQPINVTGERDGIFDPADAIEFYGLGVDSACTDTRVYWLIVGKQPGQRIPQVPAPGKQGGAGSFSYSVERKDRTVYFSALRNGDKENFFGAIIAANPVDQTISLQHVDVAATGDAVLEVALQGVTKVPHRVRVELNGREAGELKFDGQIKGAAGFRLPHSVLIEGQNLVRLTREASRSDISLVDYVRITYQHRFTADDDALRVTARGRQVVTVDGFSSGAIRVFDVTDPESTRELKGTIDQNNTGYAVSVAVQGTGERTLLAINNESVRGPLSVTANLRSSWRLPERGADLLIITTRALAGSADPLKSLRQSQGLSVSVVDIEDVYDEFSFGQKSPQAVREFVSYTQTSWKKKPRFVLLIGDASFDPKNYLGKGYNDIVPSKLIDTVYMETASDDWFADFDGDGAPELAMGRLPARSFEEASRIVAKIVGYDRASPAEGVLLVADANDRFDFEAASAQLRSLLPADLKVEEINRGRAGDQTRSLVLDAISRGQKIVNFTGHGNVGQWRGDALTSADAATLGNDQNLSLFVMMTCLNGYFHDASVNSLAESLMKAERRAAVAAWASSGQCDPGEQAAMNQQFYRLIFGKEPSIGKPLTIGEATMKSKTAISDRDIRRTWILFGDPSMRLR